MLFVYFSINLLDGYENHKWHKKKLSNYVNNMKQLSESNVHVQN